MLALVELGKRITEMIESGDMTKREDLIEQLLKVDEEFGIRDIMLTENGIEFMLGKEEFNEFDEDEFDLFDLM
ncbi:hypothetical protein [Sporosarcina sp. FSL K6-3457]|uniref:hypothetical protein n=1 Tax=Sporosarcina sp. FSL K6-3457 TaxID=2978204 RepID=UPI0030F579F7